MKKKNVLMMALSLTLVAVIAIGGTLAFFSTNTNELTNTFTLGKGYDNGALKLDETAKTTGSNPTSIDNSHRVDETGITYAPVYPGSQIAKDPTLRLKNNSPESYVFAKVENLQELVNKKGQLEDGTEVSAFIVNNSTPGTVGNSENSALNSAWRKIANIGEDGEPDFDSEVNTSLDGYYCLAANNGKVTINDVDASTKPDEYTALPALFQTVALRSDLTVLPSQIGDSIGNIKISGYAIQAENMTDATTALKAYFN